MWRNFLQIGSLAVATALAPTLSQAAILSGLPLTISETDITNPGTSIALTYYPVTVAGNPYVTVPVGNPATFVVNDTFQAVDGAGQTGADLIFGFYGKNTIFIGNSSPDLTAMAQFHLSVDEERNSNSAL